MAQIKEALAQAKDAGRLAFMPFVTAGDPDLVFTARLLNQFASWGCDLCEIGLPYSDPIADGPVIQASYTRALEAGVTVDAIFSCLEQSPSTPMPLITMASYAIVHRLGAEKFIQRALQAGVSGTIVPDLPYDEAASLGQTCRQHNFDLIPLIAPTTPDHRAAEIAQHATGFIYYVSVTGITGARDQLAEGLAERVTWLRSQTDLPICVGFGISQPTHVRALVGVADGVIVGSSIVRQIAAAASDPAAKFREIEQYVRSMMSAC